MFISGSIRPFVARAIISGGEKRSNVENDRLLEKALRKTSFLEAGIVTRPGPTRKAADAFLRSIEGLSFACDDDVVDSLSFCVLVGLGRSQRLAVG